MDRRYHIQNGCGCRYNHKIANAWYEQEVFHREANKSLVLENEQSFPFPTDE